MLGKKKKQRPPAPADSADPPPRDRAAPPPRASQTPRALQGHACIPTPFHRRPPSRAHLAHRPGPRRRCPSARRRPQTARTAPRDKTREHQRRPGACARRRRRHQRSGRWAPGGWRTRRTRPGRRHTQTGTAGQRRGCGRARRRAARAWPRRAARAGTWRWCRAASSPVRAAAGGGWAGLARAGVAGARAGRRARRGPPPAGNANRGKETREKKALWAPSPLSLSHPTLPLFSRPPLNGRRKNYTHL